MTTTETPKTSNATTNAKWHVVYSTSTTRAYGTRLVPTALREDGSTDKALTALLRSFSR